ncbi:MAG: rhomboid family intramembrane serine protease [Kiritimatiellia bacterium]
MRPALWMRAERMRDIGQLISEKSASVFCDYAVTQGIVCQPEKAEDGAWHIWVEDEDRLQAAAQMLREFQAHPEDPVYLSAEGAAAEFMTAAEKEEKEAAKRTFDRNKLWGGRTGRLTTVLMGISILVSVVSLLGARLDAVRFLFITGIQEQADVIQWLPGLPEIRHGQLWRLITPIFLHFGIWHIFFNMMWLRDLGGMIERIKGPWFLGILIAVIAALSNLGQFYVSGPLFGGMSGVVYGMLGYVWMKGKYDPGSGLYLHPSTVKMMIVWFFLCLTGLMGPIANTVHGLGLGLGVVWGYISARLRR